MNLILCFVSIFILYVPELNCMDTEYSNEQGGVKFKLLSLDSELPHLRIENKENLTLVIKNTMGFVVTFKLNGIKANRSFPKNPLNGEGQRQIASEIITLLSPDSNLELPIYGIYFNYNEDGRNEEDDWNSALSKMPSGKYTVSMTTNGIGMTALDNNSTPFKSNFNIPDFEITVNESTEK